MADLVDLYLERLAGLNYSEATIKSYRQDLRAAEDAIGVSLVRATEDQLESYLSQLGLSGIKPTTIRRRQASLRGFYKFCRKRKVMKRNPTEGFEPPRMAERVPVFLTSGQVDRLLASLTTDTPQARRDAAIIQTFYYTGMRSAELVGLTVEALNLDDLELRVIGKGDKERLLPIGDRLEAALKVWLKDHPTGTGPLFVSTRYPYRPLRYSGVRDVVAAAMAQAGLAGRKFSPHKLRHTFATRLVNRKVSIDKIQKLLGHRMIETTTRYAHTQLGDELRGQMGDAL